MPLPFARNVPVERRCLRWNYLSNGGSWAWGRPPQGQFLDKGAWQPSFGPSLLACLLRSAVHPTSAVLPPFPILDPPAGDHSG